MDLSTDAWANPSSAHSSGRLARASLDEARARLFSSIRSLHLPGRMDQAPGERIAFTASGTEADQIPLLALLRNHLTRPNAATRILVSSVEHSAVWAQAELLGKLGIAVDTVDPREDGRVHPEDVAARMQRDTALVAVMAVNNETGAVQDIRAIAAAIHARSGDFGLKAPGFHVDCVQALGKVGVDLSGATSAAFSAHKIRGPKGSGALFLASPIEALALGGGQEGGLRSGTESLQAAWGMTLAAGHAEAVFDSARVHAIQLESDLIRGLAGIPGARAVPECRIPGDARWSPFIVSVAFPGLSGEVFARALSDAGVMVSTGSACSQASHAGRSGRKPGSGRRRILDAMGLPGTLALSAIRISTGEETTPEDIARFLETASTLYRKLKT